MGAAPAHMVNPGLFDGWEASSFYDAARAVADPLDRLIWDDIDF